MFAYRFWMFVKSRAAVSCILFCNVTPPNCNRTIENEIIVFVPPRSDLLHAKKSLVLFFLCCLVTHAGICAARRRTASELKGFS